MVVLLQVYKLKGMEWKTNIKTQASSYNYYDNLSYNIYKGSIFRYS